MKINPVTAQALRGVLEYYKVEGTLDKCFELWDDAELDIMLPALARSFNEHIASYIQRDPPPFEISGNPHYRLTLGDSFNYSKRIVYLRIWYTNPADRLQALSCLVPFTYQMVFKKWCLGHDDSFTPEKI
jgi:hypothetical protein